MRSLTHTAVHANLIQITVSTYFLGSLGSIGTHFRKGYNLAVKIMCNKFFRIFQLLKQHKTKRKTIRQKYWETKGGGNFNLIFLVLQKKRVSSIMRRILRSNFKNETETIFNVCYFTLVLLIYNYNCSIISVKHKY